MTVRTTMPPMPPMGGMPGMPGSPMGGMGMVPPAPMGGSMAPMGAPMPPMPPMPPQMPAPSASAGTLPSPSNAGQRAGFRQFAGAIQNMKAPTPSMPQQASMGLGSMGPMGSMPQDIFGMPMGISSPMGSMVSGGMPVPALPGRMPDAGRRAVGMKDGGLAGVRYMQSGGSAKPNLKEFMDATGVDFATASNLLYGAVGSDTDVRNWDAIMSSSDPVGAAQAGLQQMRSSGIDVRGGTGLPGSYYYDEGTNVGGGAGTSIVGDFAVVTDSRGNVVRTVPVSHLTTNVTQDQNVKYLLESGANLADIQALVPDVDLSGYSDYEFTPAAGDFLLSNAAEIAAQKQTKDYARQALDNYTDALQAADILKNQIELYNQTTGTDEQKARSLARIQSGADKLAEYGFTVDTSTGRLVGRPDVPLVSGVSVYPDNLKLMMSPATLAAYYGRFPDSRFNTGAVTSGTGGTTGFVGGTGVTGGGSGSTGGGAGSTFTEIGGGVGSGTVGGGIFAPPAGSGYEPTGYDAARFVQGMSDIYGTRPVSYIGSPEVIASGPLGTINLPARPETVNIYDWLSQSVFDYDPTQVGASLYRDGGEVARPFDPPRRTDIRGQDHMLAYITPHEAGILKALGGTGEAGPMGIPSYPEPGYGTGGMGDPAGQSEGAAESAAESAAEADAAADAAADSSGGGNFDAFGNEYGSATEAAVADAVAEAAATAANVGMGQAGTGGYGASAASAVGDALGLGGPSTTGPSQPSAPSIGDISSIGLPSDFSMTDPTDMSQLAPLSEQNINAAINAPTAPDTTPSVSMSPASITAMSDIANMTPSINVDDPLGLLSVDQTISLSDPVASKGTGTSQMSVSPAAISNVFAEDVAMSQPVAPSMPGGLSSVAPSMDTAPSGIMGISTPATAPTGITPGIDRGLAQAAAQGLVSSTVDSFGTMSPSAVSDVANEFGLSVSEVQSMVDNAVSGLNAPAGTPSTSVSTNNQSTNVSPETIAEDLAPTTSTPTTTTQTTMTTRPPALPDVNLSLKDQIDMAITNLTETLKGKTQSEINDTLKGKGYTPAEISMFNATSTNTQRASAEQVENAIGARDELLQEVEDTTATPEGEEQEATPFSPDTSYTPETLEQIMTRITSPTTLGRRMNVTSGGPNVFFPSGSNPVRMQDGGEPNYRRMARDYATQFGVDPDIFTKLVIRESGFNPNAKSRKDAFGLTQVMPDTARKPGYGVKPLENVGDPAEQLRFGAEYLAAMLNKYGGDYPSALAAYNAGPGAVDEAGGVPNFKETREYVDYILGTTRPKMRPSGLGGVDAAPSGETRPRARPENLADLIASLERPRVPSGSLRPQMRPAPTISSQDRFAQLQGAASGKDSLGMAVDDFLKSMAAE